MVMKDCNFYCCDEFKSLKIQNQIGEGHDGPNRTTFHNYDGTMNNYYTTYLKFCPYCGTKLR